MQLTIQDLHDKNLILLDAIAGSHAYGLNTPTSDVDVRGVFIMPPEYFYRGQVVEQVSDKKNDVVYYEIGRFVELLEKNNPNIIELLKMPEDCVKYRDPIMDLFPVSDVLSQKCRLTFGGYAIAQIKKARGQNKMIMNPMDEKRKEILDFCYKLEGGKSIPMRTWLQRQYEDVTQSDIGLAKVDHARGVYAVYLVDDYFSEEIKFHGIQAPDGSNPSNEVRLSSIPRKGVNFMGFMSYNKDGYVQHCRDYKQYWEWVNNRNEARYTQTQEIGKNVDFKNMMHTFRLLIMAEDIIRKQEIPVRVDADTREFLMSIRRGEYDYDYLVEKAEERIKMLDMWMASTKLPKLPRATNLRKALERVRKDKYFG